MVAPDDKAPPEETSASYREVFNTQTLWIVLLLSLVLIAFVCTRPVFPKTFPLYLSWIIPMTLLGALVAVERRSISHRTLNVLLWGMCGIVLERILGIILWYDLIPPLSEALWLADLGGGYPLSTFNWTIGLISGFFWLFGFSIGVFAGLLWPDRLLLPVFRIRTFLWLRVLINVVLIALVIPLLTSAIIYALGHVLPDTTDVRGVPLSAFESEGDATIDADTLEDIRRNTPPIRVGSFRDAFVLVGITPLGVIFSFSMFGLVIVPVLLILAGMSAGGAPQARRVLLWGATGLVFWQIATIVLFVVLQVGPTQLWDALDHRTPFVPGLAGFALGAWVGIRRSWTLQFGSLGFGVSALRRLESTVFMLGEPMGIGWLDRLVPRRLPLVHVRSTGVGNLAVLAAGWVYAMVVLWAAEKAAELWIGDPQPLSF